MLKYVNIWIINWYLKTHVCWELSLFVNITEILLKLWQVLLLSNKLIFSYFIYVVWRVHSLRILIFSFVSYCLDTERQNFLTAPRIYVFLFIHGSILLSCIHWYLDPLVARPKEGPSNDVDHITYMRKLLELLLTSEDALHDLHPEYTEVHTRTPESKRKYLEFNQLLLFYQLLILLSWWVTVEVKYKILYTRVIRKVMRLNLYLLHFKTNLIKISP